MPPIYSGSYPSGSTPLPTTLPPAGQSAGLYAHWEVSDVLRPVQSATVEISGEDGYYKKLPLRIYKASPLVYTCSVTPPEWIVPSTSNVLYSFKWEAVDSAGETGSYTTYARTRIIEAVAPPPTPTQYTLTITAPLGGTTNPAPGQYQYAEGSIASVRAIPDVNYVFDHWTLDAVNVGSSNPVSFNMAANHTLEAVFAYSPAPTPEVAPTVAPPVAPPAEEVPPTVEVVPSPAPPLIAIPPPPQAPPTPITPETAGVIFLGALAVVAIIGAAIWYLTKPPS